MAMVKNADERTQRAMDEVAEDEFVHACTSVWEGSDRTRDIGLR